MLSGVTVLVHGRVIIPINRLLVTFKNVEFARFRGTVAALNELGGFAVDGVEDFSVIGGLLARRIVVFTLAELTQFGLPLVSPIELGRFFYRFVKLF